MKTKTYCASSLVSFAMAFSIGTPQAKADEKQDRNLAILKTLYTKIAQTPAAGGNSLGSGHNFLVLAVPGIAIDPALDIQKADDRVLLGKIANQIPYAAWTFQDSGLTVDRVYQQVLEHHDTAKVSLTQQQKATLEAAKKVLMKPDGTKSQKVAEYEAYKSQYDTAIDNLAAAKALSLQTGTPIKQTVITAVTAAANALVTLGHKNEVEAAQGSFKALTALDPAQYFNQLEANFGTNIEVTLSGTPYPVTEFIPRFDSWSKPEGWDFFSMDDKDVLTTASSVSTSVGGSASAGWGLWSVGGSYHEATTKTHEFSDIKNFSIAAKLRYVRVDRPGINSLVFRLRNWRWDSTQGANAFPISSGTDIESGTPPTGLMPLYITGFLLAKDVNLSGAWDTTELDTYKKHVDGGGRVGWGPFSVGGHYSRDESNSTFKGQFSKDGVFIPDMQIIGYFCDVLPQSPYPDPTLTWDPPLKFGDFPAIANAAFYNADQKAIFLKFEQMQKSLKPITQYQKTAK